MTASTSRPENTEAQEPLAAGGGPPAAEEQARRERIKAAIAAYKPKPKKWGRR